MSLQDSHQISDVKVMLVKGIDGNGIASIEKTGSQGLVDVYTITYTDGTKSTFTVTNGANAGMSARIFISSEAGSDVSVTSPSAQSLVVEQVSGSSTLWFCDTTEYGTHIIDAVLSGDDAQVSLNVDACKIYTVDDSHFHADITATFPSGATCSCGKSGETPAYASTNPYTFTVHSAGEYIITVSAYSQTYTETVTITTSGQEESVTCPVGSTVTPTDDVQTLLACAMIGDSEITTLAGLLADSTILSTVIASNNAIDYLVRSTTFATDVCADQTAMSYIGLNNYASNTLLADNTWNTAVCNSTYFESVLNVKVPTMTSNTTPSGECSASSFYGSTTEPWKAFDGQDTSKWQAQTTSYPQWLQYEFDDAVKVEFVKFVGMVSGSGNGHSMVKEFYFQGSNDNFTNDSHDLVHDTVADSTSARTFTYNFVNETSYKYYRLYFVSTYATGNYFSTKNVQFYGRDDV